MKKNTNKAFTLVELIVVITILAVLGTIAFISLQGYSADARDAKKVSDVNSLIKKINIEVTKGSDLATLVSGGNALSGTIATVSAAPTQWTVNFAAIKENADAFKDGTTDYPFSYAKGWSGTGSYSFMQMAATLEADNTALVVGNYYKMHDDDSEGIITLSGATDLDTDTNVVTDGGSVLAY